MVEVRRISLVKPTLKTSYHIDFDWWKQHDRDWRVYLRGYLCPEHQAAFANLEPSEMVDWVDPETAEVQRVDGLQNVLINHCAKHYSFITQQTTLVDAIFRLFLANGNTPLTPEELSLQLGRDPNTILKTISGARVYRGLRPLIV